MIEIEEQKLIMMQGLPGSGKSTIAREAVEKNPTKMVIVSRDSIRDMLGTYWVPQRESLVTLIEDSMIASALEEGYTVVVDATNLNPKTIAKLEDTAEVFDIPLIPVKVRTPLEVCIQRDKERGESGGRTVGESVIRNFHKKYNL